MHRASGYIILALLFITPLTAVDSDWVVGHSSKAERVAMVVGLACAAGGVAGRISSVSCRLFVFGREVVDFEG